MGCGSLRNYYYYMIQINTQKIGTPHNILTHSNMSKTYPKISVQQGISNFKGFCEIPIVKGIQCLTVILTSSFIDK